MRITIIGAGPAGLAVAACLKRVGRPVRMLERADRIAPAWHGHYDRLHLHTPKSRSALPGLPMPADWPRYPARGQLIEYLEAYAGRFGIAPVFGAEVTDIRRGGAGWQITHAQGTETADAVVVATGMATEPLAPAFPGLETFPGPVLHSSAYRNPASLPGARCLVVGFGNSGGEIALDLSQAGRAVDLVVRGPVNLLPRELLGVPIVSFGLLQKLLPYRVADAITAPVLRLAMGDYGRYGLVKHPKGPVTQLREDGRVPLIDIGALARIRTGAIRVRPGIARFDGPAATFADGARAEYDALLLATGYRVDLRPLFASVPEALDAEGRPRTTGGEAALPGLYFCAFRPAPNGQIRAIGAEALAIAAALARETAARAG